MNVIAAALLLVACGWYLYRTFLPTKYSALTDTGHPQYFGAVIAAAYLGLLGVCVHAALRDWNFYSWLVGQLAQLVPPGKDDDTKSLVGVLPIVVWAVTLGLLLPQFFNLPLRNKSLQYEVRVRFGKIDDIDRVIKSILPRGLSLAVTLTSNKVYVGIPGSERDQGPRAWLAMIPLASGYRSETGRLRLTTPYLPTYAQIAETDESALEDFAVMLPMSHVVSVQAFDMELYDEYFGAGDEGEEVQDEEVGAPEEENDAEDASELGQLSDGSLDDEAEGESSTAILEPGLWTVLDGTDIHETSNAYSAYRGFLLGSTAFFLIAPGSALGAVLMLALTAEAFRQARSP